MKIVRRTYRDVVHTALLATQFINVTIETLEFGKEMRVRKIRVNDSDGIFGIDSGYDLASDFLDCLHVARSDIAGRPDQCEPWF